MARSRSTGVSGVAVAFMVTGAYVVYAGIRDVPLLEGFRALLKGERPESRTPDQSPYDGPTLTPEQGYNVGQNAWNIATAVLTGVPSGPVPIEQTAVVPGTSIRVHRSMLGHVTALITDARAAGHDLDGHGWRDSRQQRELREQHGYTSDSQPSGSGGRLPVAVPGTSRHERGTAIDFTVGGAQLTRVHPAHRWLEQNAHKYKLRPFRAEPWHWSVDGR